MQFRITHLLLAVTLVAIFFAMRRWWVTSEDDRIAGATPIVVAVLCGVSLGASKRNGLIIFGGAGVGGLAAALPFAFEAVYHSPDTAFLRRHWIQAQYSDDPELNAIAVVALTVVCTIIGGLAGLVARLLIGKTGGQWFRRGNRGKTN